MDYLRTWHLVDGTLHVRSAPSRRQAFAIMLGAAIFLIVVVLSRREWKDCAPTTTLVWKGFREHIQRTSFEAGWGHLRGPFVICGGAPENRILTHGAVESQGTWKMNLSFVPVLRVFQASEVGVAWFIVVQDSPISMNLRGMKTENVCGKGFVKTTNEGADTHDYMLAKNLDAMFVREPYSKASYHDRLDLVVRLSSLKTPGVCPEELSFRCACNSSYGITTCPGHPLPVVYDDC